VAHPRLEAAGRFPGLLAQVVEYSGAMGTIGMLLRANALYLVTASTAAFLMEAVGVRIAGIGFVDAHELALIAGLLLWSASPRPCWHFAAAAVHVLFAAANLAHWQTFVSADIVAMGCVTTFVHAVFAALQVRAARGASVTFRVETA
jgi:hypothetical protein